MVPKPRVSVYIEIEKYSSLFHIFKMFVAWLVVNTYCKVKGTANRSDTSKRFTQHTIDQ